MEIKLIPGTKNFSISKDGRVFNSATKEMKQYKNGDGYKTVAVVKNSGKWQTYGLHRK